MSDRYVVCTLAVSLGHTLFCLLSPHPPNISRSLLARIGISRPIDLSMNMANTSIAVYENSEIFWSRSLRFWLLLIFDIPSLLCSFFVLYHLLSNRASRCALHNHTVIVLLLIALIFQMTDIPWYLDFIRHGFVRPSAPTRCLIWWLVDLGFYNTNALVLAWASIERHILVFHNQWVSTRRKRFFCHYAPLVCLLLYSMFYYALVIFVPPCKHTFIYTLPVCAASPCHLLHPILGLWEMGVHGCLSTMIIALFSIALPIRVIKIKYRGTQCFRWRKYRKMILQLLSISVLYLLLNFPVMIISVARLCGLPADAGVQVQLVAFFLTYGVMFLLPFVCLASLPRSKKQIGHICCKQKQRQATVVPTQKQVRLTGHT